MSGLRWIVYFNNLERHLSSVNPLKFTLVQMVQQTEDRFGLYSKYTLHTDKQRYENNKQLKHKACETKVSIFFYSERNRH